MNRLPQVQRLVAKAVQWVQTRRYLLGVVLAWILIVFLAAAPSSEIVAPSPRTAPVGAQPAPSSALPAPTSASAQVFAPTPSPVFAGLGPITFTPPPAAPPSGPQFNCPYPIPQAQSPPLQPGIFLSFEGPLIEMSGPLASYDIPTLGAIAPVVPIATPLISISQPVLSAVTPNLSVIAGDYVSLINQAGLNSPQEQQYAQMFLPYWLQLLNSLTPAEQALASSAPGQCLIVSENELAIMANQLNLQLPTLPLLPSGIPPSSSGAAAVVAASAADTRSPFAQLVLPWSGGVPTNLAAAVAALTTKGAPVLLDLVDQPPPGQTVGGTGFADFVALVVHGAPKAAAIEIDGPTSDPAGVAQMADLVHGLAAAEFTRQPGELLGLGVPTIAEGAGGLAFWKGFAAAMGGWQRAMVDFVGADLTPQAEPSVVAYAQEAAAMAAGIRTQAFGAGGVPTTVSLFAALSSPAGALASVVAVQQLLAAYLGALAQEHVFAVGLVAGS